MAHSKKNENRMLAKVARVLWAAFGPILRSGSPPLENPPRTPGKEYLYESRKPYDSSHLPPDCEAAEARLAWRREQIDDWFDRGLGERYKRVSYEVRHGLYERRKHTYQGHPESVMAAAIKEKKFLKRWIERACGPPPQPRPNHDRPRPHRADGHRKPPGKPLRPSYAGRSRHP